MNEILKFPIPFRFWRKQTGFSVYFSAFANLAMSIIMISVHSAAPLHYLNFLTQFRKKSLNKRTYHFVDVLLQNLELFKRNM